MSLTAARVFLIAIATAALCAGCASRSVDETTNGIEAAPAESAEDAARVMLEALRTGDVETFLAYTDTHGLYNERFPEAMRRVFTYEQFMAALENAKTKVGDGELNKFKDLSYEIVGVEERGIHHVVSFKTQSRPGKDWKLWEAIFGRFDGTWKLTGRGLSRIRTPGQ
jgi:hypothetical protein